MIYRDFLLDIGGVLCEDRTAPRAFLGYTTLGAAIPQETNPVALAGRSERPRNPKPTRALAKKSRTLLPTPGAGLNPKGQGKVSWARRGCWTTPSLPSPRPYLPRPQNPENPGFPGVRPRGFHELREAQKETPPRGHG